MFVAVTILVILICAVPLTMAVGFAINIGGLGTALAITVGIGLFIGASTMIIRGLVIKNNQVNS